MRHRVTQKKSEMTEREGEDGHARVRRQLNLFPRVCLRDAQQPLSENGQARFMRGEIIRQITDSGQITDGISVAPASVHTDDRSNLSPSTYLTTIAQRSSGRGSP